MRRVLLCALPLFASLPAVASAPTPRSGETGCNHASIYFAPGSARLDAAQTRRLRIFVADERAQMAPSSRYTVTGHTDESGPTDRNLALSRRRAEQVRNHLVRMGMPPSRLRLRAMGESEPAGADHLDRDWEVARDNRRVEIYETISERDFERHHGGWCAFLR